MADPEGRVYAVGVELPQDEHRGALAALAMPEAAAGPRFYWAAADGSESLAAFGTAHVAAAEGPDRHARVQRALARARALVIDHGPPPGARWVGGFAFEDDAPERGSWSELGAMWFALPRVLVTTTPDITTLTVTASGDPKRLTACARALADRLSAAPAPPTWTARPVRSTAGDVWARVAAAASATELRRRVESALQAIAAGHVEKVVVAAARTTRYDRPIDPLAALEAVRTAQPDSAPFLVSRAPGIAFVGASPERLVRVSDGRLWTTVLAGSAPRDPDPARDEALGRALLASDKDRVEHALVLDAVRDALQAAGHEVTEPPPPVLRRLPGIQHLETPLSARLADGADVLLEARRLHPTPAIGGKPRQRALALIRSIEGRPRGWFGGGVGWCDGRGNGEVVVAIRSLLVCGDTVTAFAGAGIVAGSDPDAEVREIELKLDAVLGALRA